MCAIRTSLMTSRERVLAAVCGQPVDRVPVMFWLNPHATCRLISCYQSSSNRIASALASAIWNRFVRCGELDAGQWTRAFPLLFEELGNQDYALELGADLAILAAEFTSPAHVLGSLRSENGQLRFKMSLGATLGLGGIYADPLAPAVSNPQQLAEYRLPPVSEKQFASVRKFRSTHPQACLLVEIMTFQQALMGYILGTPDFMLGLYDHPKPIKDFMNRLEDWVIEIIRQAAQAGADLLYLQDDYGSTDRPLISLSMWREFTYPHLKRLIAAAHAEGLPMVLHSCGYQMCFLEDYVNAGLDALQSFQPKAGNDFEKAYAQYGDHLTFATGIDTQRGELMTPQELREDILHAYRIGRSKGHFILAMTHMLQYSMPLENVSAIFNTAHEIQAGLYG